jgi:membrane dipeptidase
MMRKLCGAILLAVLAAVWLAGLPQAAEKQTTPSAGVSSRAAEVHRRAIVVDTHDDTPQRLLFEKTFDLSRRDAAGHIDIPRMREGGLDAVFFSIWVPSKTTGPKAVELAVRQIDSVREAVRKRPGDLVLATTAAEVRRAHKQGKIAVLVGMEGGHMIDDDLGMLRMYAALGVRYLTLTHFYNNNWADASTDTPRHNGLTEFGRQVVRELNRLGVMVDISHVSDKTFYDVLEVSRAPIIASHSSCRALCDHPRNMSDAMIRALAKKGGVIQINYHVSFLDQDYLNASRARGREVNIEEEEVNKKCAEDEACKVKESGRIERELMATGKLPKVSWEKIVEHIDHVVKLVGPDYVGLGSDFDGATMPFGMEDVSLLPKLTAALLKKGYAEKDIEKILGGNVLRVMEGVQRVSREMPAAVQK